MGRPESVINLREGAPRDDDRPVRSSGVQAKLDALGRRWPWFGRVLDVRSRYSELHGDSLAAAVTLLAFLSLFPLLLVGIAVVGFFSAHSSTLATDAVGRMGLSGEAAKTLTTAIATARESRRAASIIGLAGLAWAGLGLVGALQYAYNQVWQITQRGWKDRLVGVAWLAGAAVIIAISAGLAALLRALPGVFAPLAIVAGLAVNVALFLWTSHTLPNRNVGWRSLLPGAIAGGIGLEALKIVGAIYVPRAVASSSALYGSLGIVFAVLAWLMFFGKLLVYSEVVNVVLYERKEGTREAVVEIPDQPGVATVATRSGQVEHAGSRA